METTAVSLVRSISGMIQALFGSLPGLILLGGITVVLIAGRIGRVLADDSLKHEAAGKQFTTGKKMVSALGELCSITVRVAGQLPIIVMTALILLSITGIAEVMTGLDEAAKNDKRIKELSAVVKNLERRTKAAEIRCVGNANGILDIEASFFSPFEQANPAKIQKFSIPGKEIYFDSVVFNFDYSEIEAGKALNLAIPYRIFSDSVAQTDGIELSVFDEQGIPYLYRMRDGDLYGISKDTFDARLGELIGMMKTDAEARKAGIVRSLYGNAVHTQMRKGDLMQVWIEQTGGLTIKDAHAF